jgi:sulfur-oxidizing protein SoxZ
MAEAMKIRAHLAGDMANVKCLMNHPMETGMRRDAKSGKVIPANYITQVSATLNGMHVMDAQLGSGIAKNPYLSFWIQGAKAGNQVVVSWVDSTGDKNSAETMIV